MSLAIKPLYLNLLGLFVAVATFAASPAFADTYLVRPLTTSGVPKDELESVQALVVMGVREAGGDVNEKATTADFEITGKLVKLGGAYILGLQKVRDGKTVYQTQARSKSLDDMDTVANRVARSVVTEKAFESDTHVSDVTEDQVTHATRRRQAVRQWSIGLGPAMTSNLRSSNSAVAWLIGYSWGIDPKFDLRLALDGTSVKDSNAGYSDFTIGVGYYFFDRDSSPYVSGEFGYGWATADDRNAFIFSGDKASGFMGAAGAGMKFFRTSSVNLSVGLRYALLFDTTSAGHPSATSLVVAVHF